MIFESTIRHITQMTLGNWLRVQMMRFGSTASTFLRPCSSKQAARPLVACYRRNARKLEQQLVILMLMMFLGVNTIWGQTDYSGTYYIATGSNPTIYSYLE